MRTLLQDQLLVQLATRYSLHTVNLVWGLRGPRLQVHDVNGDQFRDIFDRTLVRLSGEAIEEDAPKRTRAGTGPSDFGEAGRPDRVEPDAGDLTPDDITIIGASVEAEMKALHGRDVKEAMDKGREHILRGQARA